MKINITPPRHYSDFYLHTKTKEYLKGEYNKLKAWNVFEGERKGYYLYITKEIFKLNWLTTEKKLLMI